MLFPFSWSYCCCFPIIRGQLRKAAEKNAATQSFLVESLNGVQTIKAQNAENNVRWQWQRRYSSFMSETFRTLMIGVSAGTIGGFLNQLTGLLTLWGWRIFGNQW